MAKPADIGSKRLIGLYPDTWLQWVTQRPDVVARGILAATEFQWISRETDAIIRASSPEVGEFLVVNDIQLRCDQWMPWRTHAYAALAEEKYHLPVYAVVVNLLPPGPNTVIPDRYEHTLFGLTARRDFRVINLWEVDVDLVFQTPLPPLLPFVPLLRGGGNEPAVRQAVRELRNHETLRDMEVLLAFFARFVLESRVIREIMRWDMVVLQESPWYQEIRHEGWLVGWEEGREEGLQIARRRTIQRALQLRFGAAPPDLVSRLEPLKADQLEPLVDAAWLAPSLEAFIAEVPPPAPPDNGDETSAARAEAE